MNRRTKLLYPTLNEIFFPNFYKQFFFDNDSKIGFDRIIENKKRNNNNKEDKENKKKKKEREITTYRLVGKN